VSREARGGRGSGGMTPVGNVLDQVLSGLKLEERFKSAGATELWYEVVGPDVARRTYPAGVRGGELLVEVEGAVWMGHLAVLRQGILDDLNGRLPADARLSSIRLVPMRRKEERFDSER